MHFREATINDIPQLSAVRLAVRENRLSRPDLITAADYAEFLTERGKGWLCETEGKVVGFAVVDLQEHNVWALFVHPDEAERGIGKELHRLMLDWYFQQTQEPLWLGTAPGTRAEVFYEKMGWRRVGTVNKGEVKFDMHADQWQNTRPRP